MNKQALLQKLYRTRDETLEYFKLTESSLLFRYGFEKWSIKEILHHLADAEMVLHYRLKKIIAEPNSLLWGYDQNLWADRFDYQQASLTAAKDLFELMRNLNIQIVQEYLDIYADNNWVHSGMGRRTLAEEMEKIGNHNATHLAQIELALVLKLERPEIYLNNKTFKAKSNSANGEVDDSTRFYYRQEEKIIWATYHGGQIKHGTLNGIFTSENQLEFHYTHVSLTGKLQTGRCITDIKIVDNQKLELHEKWQWTSGDKSEGSSVLVEE